MYDLEFTPGMRSAKVGTVPMLIILRYNYGLHEGQRVLWREASHGSKYHTGIVRGTEPVLFLDRHWGPTG
ncbi:hypothetical protein LCGC14_2859180 [marine sediment metagenome]|uniref:Uncharacterized protein n=1 Tax=marine sediment metagenome TaxID=412755 RepID=A0A0F9AX77_9ZZZZ